MKKLFTLFALLVAIVTGAWAQSTTLFEMKNVTGITKTNGDAAVEGTDYVGPGSYGSGSSAYTIAANNIGILNGVTVKLSATYDYNGKVEAYNGHSTKGNLTINTSTSTSWAITISNSGGSYLKVTLPEGTTIAQGDKITVTSNNGTRIRLTGEANKSKGAVADSWPYVVPSGSNLISESGVFYIMYNGGDMTEITSIKVERPSADEVATPTVTLSGKQVTLECTTTGSSIYYTLDGSEPTSTSTLYSEPFNLTASCTVRAKAFKGENSSEEKTQDCYIDNSEAEGILQVVKYSGGTVSGTTWTDKKTNKELTLTASTNNIESVNLSGTSDGFKLNHTDTYTLTPSSFVKITKIVVVGKTWLAGDAATISIDGFTPASGTFFAKDTYVKSIEFTPSSELDYGAAVTIAPGTNQLGAYIEVYGVKKDLGITYDSEIAHGTITGSATAKTNEQVTLTITPEDGYELTALTVKRNSDGADRSSWCKASVKNGTFIMYTEGVTVSGTFTQIQTPIVTMPTETRTGYSVVGTDISETTVNRSSSQMHQKKVIVIPNGKTATLTVPSITEVSKIKVWGTSSDGNSSTITITGANSETTGAVTFNNRDASSTSSAEFTPTTQTTTYTIASGSKGSWVIVEVYGSEATSQTITTNAGKWTSYTPVKNATLSEGAKAYIITSIDETNEKLVGNTVDVLKAGEGYFVKGAAANTDYTVTFTDDEATATDGNMLVGCVVSTALTNEGNTKYFLGTKDDTAGLYYVGSAGITIPAGKCYLQSTSTAQMNSLALPFDEATAINNVNANDNANSVAPVKVIKNGKLYIGNYNVAGQQVK